ncbi:MAG TPA: hypothetical protein DEH02_02265 [Bacteroidales bacterium]|nr:hypothetical protein [Bacteroidales bacterium]
MLLNTIVNSIIICFTCIILKFYWLNIIFFKKPQTSTVCYIRNPIKKWDNGHFFLRLTLGLFEVSFDLISSEILKVFMI